MSRAAPVLVAGGGLAGGAAACALAGAGVAVTLVERASAPVHKICGEFLSIEAQEMLASLGIDAAALGGHPIGRVRLLRRGREVTARLPFTALGLTRRTLDAALLTHAEARGARVLRGVAVRRLDAAPGRLGLDLGDGRRLESDTLLLATGKHDLRGAGRAVRAAGELVGFKTYFVLAPAQRAALEGHVELHLLDRGYAGLQLVEGGWANLCLLVRRDRLAEAGGGFAPLLAALCGEAATLATRLDGAKPLLDQPLGIARVPYGFLHRPRRDDPAGLFRLGDQAGVIHSFTGDGMAMALHGARRAAAAVLEGQDAATYHRRLAGELAGQIRLASLLYRAQRPAIGQRLLFAALARAPAGLGPLVRLTRVRAP
ncbi:MAG TPA: FAD-dependent monooxygenase [Acidiphilium sp.]|nr:FAD-dependent monooxygenase [Acidiphilium sp.]